MVTKLKETDAVVIGMGWSGSILSRELTKAGLKVVGLERGSHFGRTTGAGPSRSSRRRPEYGQTGIGSSKRSRT